jgi:acyl-CoA synthetase (AMP-forming)/AMP-acid ligase II
MHWISGILILFMGLIGGSCVEFLPGKFDAASVWTRLRSGTVTVLLESPASWTYLRHHYEEKLVCLSKEDLKEYVAGVQHLKAISGGGRIPPSLHKFWKSLRNGKPLLDVYGLSEVDPVFAPWNEDLIPEVGCFLFYISQVLG